MVAFPLPRSEKTTHEGLVTSLRLLGFVRVQADGAMVELGGEDAEEPETLGVDLGEATELLVVVDRLKIAAGVRDRLADSVGTAFREGEGRPASSSPQGPPTPTRPGSPRGSRSPSASAVPSTRRSSFPIRRRSSSPSTLRTDRVRNAADSGRSWSTTKNSSCPIRPSRSRRGRWTRGVSPVTSGSGASFGSTRSGWRFPPSLPGRNSRRISVPRSSGGHRPERGVSPTKPSRGSSPFSARARRSGTSSTSGSSFESTRVPGSARRAEGGECDPRH
jgi:hypothetical protein